jgi:hypothetical protein
MLAVNKLEAKSKSSGAPQQGFAAQAARWLITDRCNGNVKSSPKMSDWEDMNLVDPALWKPTPHLFLFVFLCFHTIRMIE